MEDESDEKCRGYRQKPVNDVVKRGSPTSWGHSTKGCRPAKSYWRGCLRGPWLVQRAMSSTPTTARSTPLACASSNLVRRGVLPPSIRISLEPMS